MPSGGDAGVQHGLLIEDFNGAHFFSSLIWRD
jgi:hypothetical protein